MRQEYAYSQYVIVVQFTFILHTVSTSSIQAIHPVAVMYTMYDTYYYQVLIAAILQNRTPSTVSFTTHSFVGNSHNAHD